MKCPKCSNNIELINKKDRDTGMWHNYWHCENHGKVMLDENAISLKEIEDFCDSFKEAMTSVREDTIKALKTFPDIDSK